MNATAAYVWHALRLLAAAYLLSAVLWLLPKDEAGKEFRRAVRTYALSAAVSVDRRWRGVKAGLH